MRTDRSLAALMFAPALLLAVPAAAQASAGTGGGGGNPPPPTMNPAVTLSPASLTFPAELTDATSPPQTVTVSDALDSKPVGTITLSGGQGSMRPYNLGDFGARFDHVTVVNGPPPAVLGQPTVLSGGSFS